jgi:hypothetical protein
MRTTRRAWRLAAAALAAPALMAAAVAGTGLGPAQAAMAGCKSKAAQPLNPGTFRQLVSTAVLSPCNVWAVGSFNSSNKVQKTLIEHWDGSKWKVIPSPNPSGAKHSELNSVSAASPTSIWAVGEYDSATSFQTKPLILHWDGQHWTQQNNPAPGSFDFLFGVTATSGGEAWAVGHYNNNHHLGAPLALHFAAGKWTQATLPDLGEYHLSAVAATSAKDVWAVGGTPGPDASIQTVILHWDGEAWTRTPTPSPGFLAVLSSVSASSPTNALAVGYVQPQNADKPPIRTLALHWNGMTWTRVPSANPANVKIEADLNAVAFSSKGSARAVGGVDARSLIEQWNGKRFTLVKGSTTGVDLFGIAGTSASNQWAIGAKGAKTYVLHFTK